MVQSMALEFERAVRWMSQHLPVSEEGSRKPILFHDIRVGMYLYEKEYSQEIVLAGLLHDMLEWSTVREEMLRQEFGDNITRLVKANTKDDSILVKTEKTQELVQRCVAAGQEALIIKAADILDSFQWYSSQKNLSELEYCLRNAQAIFELKPAEFNDKIFEELKLWPGKML